MEARAVLTFVGFEDMSGMREVRLQTVGTVTERWRPRKGSQLWDVDYFDAGVHVASALVSRVGNSQVVEEIRVHDQSRATASVEAV
jgi:hypothetical protein